MNEYGVLSRYATASPKDVRSSFIENGFRRSDPNDIGKGLAGNTRTVAFDPNIRTVTVDPNERYAIRSPVPAIRERAPSDQFTNQVLRSPQRPAHYVDRELAPERITNSFAFTQSRPGHSQDHTQSDVSASFFRDRQPESKPYGSPATQAHHSQSKGVLSTREWGDVPRSLGSSLDFAVNDFRTTMPERIVARERSSPAPTLGEDAQIARLARPSPIRSSQGDSSEWSASTLSRSRVTSHYSPSTFLSPSIPNGSQLRQTLPERELYLERLNNATDRSSLSPAVSRTASHNVRIPASYSVQTHLPSTSHQLFQSSTNRSPENISHTNGRVVDRERSNMRMDGPHSVREYHHASAIGSQTQPSWNSTQYPSSEYLSNIRREWSSPPVNDRKDSWHQVQSSIAKSDSMASDKFSNSRIERERSSNVMAPDAEQNDPSHSNSEISVANELKPKIKDPIKTVVQRISLAQKEMEDAGNSKYGSQSSVNSKSILDHSPLILRGNAHSSERKKIVVTVKQADGLLANDCISCDTFVELVLGKQVKKSKLVENSLNPNWNEKIELECNPEDLYLDVIVYDNDMGRLFGNSKKYLGSVTIPIRDLVRRGEDWFNLRFDSRYEKMWKQVGGRISLGISIPEKIIDASASFTASPAPVRERSLPPEPSVRERSCPTDDSINDFDKVVVTVVRAEGLLAKDKGGTSDPFVELTIGTQSKKTKVVEKTLNPEWNQDFAFNCTKEDFTLEVVMYDNDKGMLYGSSKEYLGSISVPIKDVLKAPTGQCWFDLQFNPRHQKKVEKISGRILIAITIPIQVIKHAGPTQSFKADSGSVLPFENVIVSVTRAEGLLAKDKGGTSDPFVELIIGKDLKKTKVVERTLKPEWNEKFEFYSVQGHSTLELVVYDNDKGMIYGNSKEYLGSVSIPLGEMHPEGQWFALNFDSRYQKTVQNITGRIFVSISPLLGQPSKKSDALERASNSTSNGNLEQKKCKVIVSLIRAEALLAKDKGGTSDPFVELSIGKQYMKSKVIEKNLNPEWNQKFEFEAVPWDSTIDMVVFDHDSGFVYGSSKEFLGSASIPMKDVLASGSLERWFDLRFNSAHQKKIEEITGRILVNVTIASESTGKDGINGLATPKTADSISKITQNRDPSQKASKVIVSVIKAEGLLAKDKGGTSDPYAEIRLEKEVKNTKIVEKSLNPEWNETFEFDSVYQDSTLEVVLYDNDKGILYGNSKEYLGSVFVPMNEIFSKGAAEDWFSLDSDSQHSGEKVTGRILLRLLSIAFLPPPPKEPPPPLLAVKLIKISSVSLSGNQKFSAELRLGKQIRRSKEICGPKMQCDEEFQFNMVFPPLALQVILHGSEQGKLVEFGSSEIQLDGLEFGLPSEKRY